MTAIKMSMRTCATLALLLGLFMWIFNQPVSPTYPLVLIHIALAVILLVLSIVWLVMSLRDPKSNSAILGLQGGIIVLLLITMFVGSLQFNNDSIVVNIIHLILALALVGLIETTSARQRRAASKAKGIDTRTIL